jgi:hypothetical protein
MPWYDDDELLTTETLSSIFAGERFRAFCEANGLKGTPDIELTRKELRKAVLKHRSLNCQHFRKELYALGIMVNCKNTERPKAN